jgi:hypothetical protein
MKGRDCITQPARWPLPLKNSRRRFEQPWITSARWMWIFKGYLQTADAPNRKTYTHLSRRFSLVSIEF